MPIVRPIHAREGEVVDIHWHTGSEIFVERRTCPPKPTVDAKAREDRDRALAQPEDLDE